MYAYCRPCATEKSREWRKQNADRRKASKTRAHAKARYGLTLEEYTAAIAHASGTCDICGLDTSKTKKGSQLDHCHRTGKIRGVLCSKCNTGLGLFDDNIEVLLKAVAYLTEKGGP